MKTYNLCMFDTVMIKMFILMCSITLLVTLFLLWKIRKNKYKKILIENLQSASKNENKKQNDFQNTQVITKNNDIDKNFLNTSEVVSSNVNSYKQRSLIGEYSNYDEYLKKVEQIKNGQVDEQIEYKPLDLHEQPNKAKIDAAEKFFKSTLPEIEKRIPWTQDKIDAAQIPNNELCRKSITGMTFDCGVAASNEFVYEWN